MVASGFRPSAAARLADITTTAAAPSFSPDALPAVTVPALSKAGLSPARLSAVAPWRTNSSVAKATGSPFLCGNGTGTISSAKRPAFCAASALFWLAAAKASCISRVTPYFFATFSAVVPM
ncbi:hypothetical protein GALL_183070 [mine drainage metagenome]|uniref:Uncharacterized protein n=1 Tax=mine drainage metagenome TaxID=410659 RepID=A0A1J5RU98_9ZZZZ